tara:strand:+ start:3374 stop:3643 length:270 start_codon:yes stop_codon:yes gene_type:complete
MPIEGNEEDIKKKFVDYVHGYYGKGEIYDMGLTKNQIGEAYDYVMENEDFNLSHPSNHSSFLRQRIRKYWERQPVQQRTGRYRKARRFK